MLPAGGLLLGNEDGSVHSSSLLRSPVSGNPQVARHATDALASADHLASLRGGTTAAGREPSPVDRVQVAARACAPQGQRTGLGLKSSGNRHEVAQGGGSTVGGAFGRVGGARLLRRPVLVVEVGVEGGSVSAVTPDTPPLPLLLVLAAQGSKVRFDLAMTVHILADLHVLGGSISRGSGMSVLPVSLQPSQEATDDGQVGVPTHVLWT